MSGGPLRGAPTLLRPATGPVRRLIVGALAAFALATGCGTVQTGQGLGDPPVPERFVKIVTATPNEPGRLLTESDAATLRAMAAQNTGTASVVVADGPGFRKIFETGLTPLRGDEIETDPGLRARWIEGKLGEIDAALRSAASIGGQLDAVGIFDYVSRIGDPAVVSITTSGLQTSGPLAIEALTWDGVGARETVRAAAERGLVPSLAGKVVTVGGSGDVGGPQVLLPELLRRRVRDLLLQLCEAGGADRCVADDSNPSVAAPAATVPVPTVAVPDLEPLPPRPPGGPACADFTVPTDAWFAPNSAELLPGTRERAAVLGRDLAGLCDVRLVGRTATVGDSGSSRELSRRRAEATAEAMVDGGFPSERLRVEGVGFDDPLVVDRDAAGRLIPRAAQQNRSVSFVLTARRR